MAFTKEIQQQEQQNTQQLLKLQKQQELLEKVVNKTASTSLTPDALQSTASEFLHNRNEV